MTESDFWTALEYRLCEEMAGNPRKEVRRHWCDGFVPSEYRLEEMTPCILGRAWIYRDGGRRDAHGGWPSTEWSFTLILPRPVSSRDQIAWSDLLPPSDITAWLTVDTKRGRLIIEPGVAIPMRSGTLSLG